MEKEEKKGEYVSYKKLLIFGVKNSGKTTLAKSFNDNNSSQNEEDTKGKKYNNIYNKLILYK
jgi:GTPase SAR1 family protein